MILLLSTSMLIAIFCGCILYGVFSTLFIATLYVLIAKPSAAPFRGFLLGVSISMFVMTTMILALEFARLVDGFIVYPAGPTSYFASTLSDWKNVVKVALVCLNCLLADSVMIYRSWVLWDRRWSIVAFPILLFFGNIVSSFFLVINMARTGIDLGGLSEPVNSSDIAFTVFTLAQNLIVTTLIVVRIWRAHTTAAPFKQGGLPGIIWVVVESGALYSITLLISLIVNILNINVQNVMIDVISSMVGVTFSMIIVRMGLGLTRTPDEESFYEAKHVAARPVQPCFVKIDQHVDKDGSISDTSSDNSDTASERSFKVASSIEHPRPQPGNQLAGSTA